MVCRIRERTSKRNILTIIRKISSKRHLVLEKHYKISKTIFKKVIGNYTDVLYIKKLRESNFLYLFNFDTAIKTETLTISINLY